MECTRAWNTREVVVIYRKILAGVDGSPTSLKAAQRAVELAKVCGAKVTLISVGEHGRQYVSDAQDRFEGSEVYIDTVVDVGDPADVILETATDGDYDLIVVGNKGMSGVSRFLLGSVPSKISHHSPCDVLIVHTTG
jgi:nucleotide-binding universal stress UspA family protein